MIVPITPEAVWLELLANLPSWQPPPQTTVVIAPHPDDETLAAGGLILHLREAGYEVTVIAVTDGENCYPGEHPGPQRIQEQAQALARLGVDEQHIHRLHLPDSGVTAHEPALEQSLTALIAPGAHLVAPWPHDFHPDHEVCGRVAKRVAHAQHLKLTSYFFWTWHQGTPELLGPHTPVRLLLTEQEQAAKREALEYHQSQLTHPSGEPILPKRLLAPAFRPYEVFLPHDVGVHIPSLL